jgi:hypothetical protein
MAKTPSAKKVTKLARKAAAKPARKGAWKATSKAASKASVKSAGKPAGGSAARSVARSARKAAPTAARNSAAKAKAVAPKASSKASSKPASTSSATIRANAGSKASSKVAAGTRGATPALKSAPTGASKSTSNAAARSAVKNAPAAVSREVVRAQQVSAPAAVARSASHSAAHAGPVSDPNLNRALAAAVREDRTGLGKYVYCIVRATTPLSFGPIGIGGEPSDVYTVNWRELAAVISDSPPGVQDPTRENVLAHQRVNETVMMEHTVLPMSFGTVFKTREDIIEFLRSAHEAFADVLNKMENKLEFGLKVRWDRDAVLLELEQDDEDIRRLKSEIASQKGSTYFARMQYGRLVDAALQARSERYVAEIFDGLRDVAVAARSNKPIGDRMIMNAAFLVSRSEEPAFDARVKALGARYDKLTFKYTGPWPPYNFVNIRLKLERA